MKRLVIFFLALGTWHSALLWADASSTNFRIESEHATGGANLSVTSTNYKAEESAVDWFTKENLTGTNYKVDGKFGVSGVSNIAVINSVTPGDFSKFFTDESPSFTVGALDPDNDALQYQAKQDGTLKDGPRAENVLTWALGTSDKGRHTVSLDVLDPDGTVRKNQSMYAYRRPVK